MNQKILELLSNPDIQVGKRGEPLDLRKFHRHTDNRYLPQPQPQQETIIKKEPPHGSKNKDIEPNTFEELIYEVRGLDKKPKINKLRKMFKSVIDRINEDE
jgi:hypothetical protein